jgi:hypothetical protein
MKLRTSNIVAALLVLLVLAGLPIAGLVHESRRSGLTPSQVIRRMLSREGGGVEDGAPGTAEKGPPFEPVEFRPVGVPFTTPPKISHVLAADLDRDGLLDIVACDAEANRVSWIRQGPKGSFEEKVLGAGLPAPAHAQAVDFDGDGDLDLVVAVLGMLFPNNDRIGSVVVLENPGSGAVPWTPRVAAARIARASDARAGDLDGDGDLDIAVAQFGYDDGETRWIENLGGWTFQSHILQTLSGPINVELADLDRDGDLDIVSLVSQEWEEIYVFLNDGKGRFAPRLIHGSSNEDFGSSGISLCDLDRDGDLDILYTNGDAFDYIPPRPRPWHGVEWLENEGGLRFGMHRIADFPGAYNARAADVDGDGDLDIFVVSAFNFWERPEARSLILLENLGGMRFRLRDIAASPTHLLGLDVGDFEGVGRVGLVTGGMHVYSPYDRMSRVGIWRIRPAGEGAKR